MSKQNAYSGLPQAALHEDQVAEDRHGNGQLPEITVAIDEEEKEVHTLTRKVRKEELQLAGHRLVYSHKGGAEVSLPVSATTGLEVKRRRKWLAVLGYSAAGLALGALGSWILASFAPSLGDVGVTTRTLIVLVVGVGAVLAGLTALARAVGNTAYRVLMIRLRDRRAPIQIPTEIQPDQTAFVKLRAAIAQAEGMSVATPETQARQGKEVE